MLYFSVNEELCTRCGLCVRDCPSMIITQSGKTPPKISRKDSLNCIQCQHCLAICPTAAISIFKKKPEDSLPLSAGSMPDFEQMNLLVRGRRAVRHYKDENVDAELLKRILAATANAPSGVNRHQLTFSVIDDRKVMQAFRERTLSDLAAADKAGRIPEHFGYLKEAPSAYAKDKTDIIFRTAPHALIVSAGPGSVCPNEDAILALAYFELLAQSAGLGAVWWGIFKMLMAVLPDLRPRLGIPDDHTYCYAMLFGAPAVKYARTVQRDDAAIVRTVKW